MFRSFAKSMRKPILWLMLPLAVLAGRPSAGCVCSDGTVKTACCKSDWLLAKLSDSPLTQKDCCAKAESSPCRDCCSAEQSRSTGDSHYASASGCQCHALANCAISAKITKWLADADCSELDLPATRIDHLPPVGKAYTLRVPAEVLPPPDRVVLFLHLTI